MVIRKLICLLIGHKLPYDMRDNPQDYLCYRGILTNKGRCVRCGKILKKYPEPHTWEICTWCGPMVRCGYCSNNCCNGGTRESYDERPCPDGCLSAYSLQGRELDQRWKAFKKSPEYYDWKEQKDKLISGETL